MSGDWEEKTTRVPAPGIALDAEEDAFSIGNLARDNFGCETVQIRTAVELQQLHPGMKLGEAMVRLGLLDWSGLTQLIRDQKILRSNKPTEERKQLVERQAEKTKQEATKMDVAIDRFSELLSDIAKKLDK